jgi:pimeloyl-ACP methyl ester carboxylesterase
MRALLSLALLLGLTACACVPPDWGAAAILRPSRRPVTVTPALAHESLVLRTGDLTLHGWLFRAAAPRRGLIVYLHGIADNRQSAAGVAARFVPRGFDVFAYDSRAHGDSTGDACTYGYYEKGDLSRWLDALDAEPVVLVGVSLGGAVALQAAADDPRVLGVVAVSSFADLDSIVRERAPWYLSSGYVTAALAEAGRTAHFPTGEASPVRAAARIRVPVLLLYGTRDRETSPAHSQRIFAALAGPRQIHAIAGAGHSDVLGKPESWRLIDAWLDELPALARARL